MKKSLIKTLVLLLLMPLLGFTRAQLVATQGQIESEIRAFLAEQLRPGEYFVYALVEAPPEEKKDDDTKDGVLPYSSLKVPGSYLKDLLQKNLPAEDTSAIKIEVTLGLDDRLPEEKRKIIEEVVRKRFGFDGTQRILNVQALKLVTSPISEAERFDLERSKMESNQARLELEAERAKLATQQKELELSRVTTQAAQAEAQAAQALQSAQAQQSAAALPSQLPGQPPPQQVSADKDPQSLQGSLQMNPNVALFKDFQLTAMALVLGIVLVVAIVVGGSFFIRGLAPLSTAIEAVGSSIETAAKTSGASQTQVTAVSGSSGSEAGSSSGEDAKVVAHGVGIESEATQAANEEFIKQVQEKVEILCKEKRFGLFRVLSDMIETKQTLPQAAAVLVTLEGDIARTIIQELPIDQIAKLKNYLSQEGGLAKAREQRFQALSEFYGRIAVEEFTDSPLMELKDLSWLTKMSTGEIARLINSLSDQERPVFLACLSPERVKKILDTANASDKEVIIRSLALVDGVTRESIAPVVEGISSRMAKSGKSATVQRFAVDGAKYIAAVAADLSESEQAKLFEVLASKGNLIEGVREHYIPFTMVTTLPKELLSEIFSDRPDAQIAQIIFDAKEEVRTTVISAFPDIRAESIKDELRVLDGEKFYEKRNRKLSLRLQKEISRYLLRLYSEGLLSFNTAGETKQGEAPNVSKDSAA